MQRTQALMATFLLLLAMLAGPVFWVGYLAASNTADPSAGMILGLLLTTVGAVVVWKILQVKRPYRFTKRSAMTLLDELIDQSYFGVGSFSGWTYTNPRVTLADLRGNDEPFIPKPTAPLARAKPKKTIPDCYVRHTVECGDTFWSLSENLLGDGSRWNELLEANLGLEVAPGVLLQEEDLLVPGWVVAVPQFEKERT